MQEFQKRVIEEEKELVFKRDKLAEFLNGSNRPAMSDENLALLFSQLSAMNAYADILKRRIQLFG